MKFQYDVIVIGAGHAGVEAACAAANMGAKTCLVTMDMNKIAQMSCNPAIGGIAKGQIVREVDALGGFMGIVTDRTSIQFRMLNLSKGPAMWSPRAQCDRGKYIWAWREILDNTENLNIWQDQAKEIIVENGECVGVRTFLNAELYAKSTVITAGTFLNGILHFGETQLPGGRVAESPSLILSESISSFGIQKNRMKTGTPVRIDKRSVHFEDMEVQNGDISNYGFSYMPQKRTLKQLPCWTCDTNEEVHDILFNNLDRSPLYNGQIKSIGPRYCPSIETKIVTFRDKDHHPLFLEPEGENTNEMYLNGFSSSLPMDVQISALKKIPAFRDMVIYRPGYAIEYDFFDPTQLKHTLESKILPGLFFAGQVNGTTGYEEAAGQGIVAGINAALKCTSNKEFILGRDEAYIGVLIDDLVMKGVDEPYRMFTSRAEYRILLRQDDADMRLTPKSHDISLASNDRYDRCRKKAECIDEIIRFAENFSIRAEIINPALEKIGTTPLLRGCKLMDLLGRPQITIKNITPHIAAFNEMLSKIDFDNTDEIIEAAEIKIKYKGYIERERQIADKMQRLENIRIKGIFKYEELQSLSTEARQKLSKLQPDTLAQASRIPGVSPSDINVLLVLMGR